MCQGYRENKTSSLEIRRRKETSQEDAPDSVTGQADNPLETAVARLEELERNIKYLRSSFSPYSCQGCLTEKRRSASLSLQPCSSSSSWFWEQTVAQSSQASPRLSPALTLHSTSAEVRRLGASRPESGEFHFTSLQNDWRNAFISDKRKCNFIQEKSRASQRRDLQSQTAGGGLKQSCQLAAPAWLNMEAASSRSGQNRTGTDFNPASCTKKAQISKDDNSQLAVCRCVQQKCLRSTFNS